MKNIINTTAHAITFQFGDELVSIPPSRYLVNATPVERIVAEADGVKYVETVFDAVPETLALLTAMIERDPNCIIVGSIIAAQAYPGIVVAMTPMPDFERVPPDKKRMNPCKFTVFGQSKQQEIAVRLKALDESITKCPNCGDPRDLHTRRYTNAQGIIGISCYCDHCGEPDFLPLS